MSITIRPDKASWNKFWEKQRDIVKQHKAVPEAAVRAATTLVLRRVKLLIGKENLIDSGTYRRSVNAVVGKIANDAWQGEVGTWVEYAPYLEYRRNWFHRAPDGFKIFERAMEESFDDIIKIIMIELEKIK
jgi:hypothetical protein